MSTKQLQIAATASRYAGKSLTNLHHYIDAEWIRESMKLMNQDSSAGVDGELFCEYKKRSADRLPELLREFKSGQYKAPPVKRAYIPKSGGGQRPLGMPTIEDKLLQTAVLKVLEPIYELDFQNFSYGFRPGKSQHQALERLWEETMNNGIQFILDADISNYFGSINHSQLRSMLDTRIKDGVIRKQIDKWLKAGVMEGLKLEYESSGTPQGGSISPLLSNIYLDEVLDKWYLTIKPLLKGRSFLVRYADDFVMGFELHEDAQRVMKVIFQRFSKYGLTLHPEKTKLVNLYDKDNSTFDFLGFTHYYGLSRKGNMVLKRKTIKSRLQRAIKRTGLWLRDSRHLELEELIGKLNLKLGGHYSYYGITPNFRSIQSYFRQVRSMLFKWLNRRGGKRLTWQQFQAIITEKFPLKQPSIYHKLSLKRICNHEEPDAGNPLVRVCGGEGR